MAKDSKPQGWGDGKRPAATTHQTGTWHGAGTKPGVSKNWGAQTGKK
jgi:hypothetical protein